MSGEQANTNRAGRNGRRRVAQRRGASASSAARGREPCARSISPVASPRPVVVSVPHCSVRHPDHPAVEADEGGCERRLEQRPRARVVACGWLGRGAGRGAGGWG